MRPPMPSFTVDAAWVVLGLVAAGLAALGLAAMRKGQR